jgi:hypothetical protein
MGCKRKKMGVLFVCVCVCVCALKQKRRWSERERRREEERESEREEAQEASDLKQVAFWVKSKFSGCVVQDCN